MRFILCFTLLWSPIFGQEIPIEKGWKGLKVLEATRADVEKHYGEATEDIGFTLYRTEEGLLRVIYATEPCKPATFGRGIYNVPPGTLLAMSLVLGKPIPLRNLKWNKDEYQRWVNDHRPGQVEYLNYNAGVAFTAMIRDSGVETVANFEFMSTPPLREKYRCEETK